MGDDVCDWSIGAPVNRPAVCSPAGVLPPRDPQAAAAAAQRQRGGAAGRGRRPAEPRLPERREQDGGEGERGRGPHPAGAAELPRRGGPSPAHRSVLAAVVVDVVVVDVVVVVIVVFIVIFVVFVVVVDVFVP